MANSKILTAEQERELLKPIDEYVGKIQKEIDELRADGTTKLVEYQSLTEKIKRDKTLSKGEKQSELASCQKEIDKAKEVESRNKAQIEELISKAETYLKNTFASKYYNAVKESCAVEKAEALENHKKKMAELAPEANPGVPVIPQLLAKDGELAAWMILQLRELGYRRVYDVGSMAGWPYGSV